MQPSTRKLLIWSNTVLFIATLSALLVALVLVKDSDIVLGGLIGILGTQIQGVIEMMKRSVGEQ